MFVYQENPKESVEKLLELKSIVSHWIQGQCSNMNCISIYQPAKKKKKVTIYSSTQKHKITLKKSNKG